MKNIVYDITLGAANMLRRTLTSPWIDTAKFSIRTPEPELDRLFDTIAAETEERISLPFGLRLLRERWLMSTGSAGSSSATEAAVAAKFIYWFDPGLAVEILRPFFHNQSDEGNIPLVINPMSASKTPALLFLAETIYQLSGKTKINDLPAMFERFQKFSNWLVLHRKEQDGLYCHADAAWMAQDAFLYPLRRALRDPRLPTYDFRSLSLNSLVAYQLMILSRLAKKLELDREAEKFDETAKKLRDTIRDLMWDEENGLFFNLIRAEKRPVITPAAFLTLTAEIPTASQAAQVLKYLPDIHEQIEFVVQRPALAPAFDLIVEGLLKYNFVREAADLSMAFIRKTAAMEPGAKSYLPRLVACVMLVRRVIGFNKFADRYVLFPKLPAHWVDKSAVVHDSATQVDIYLTPTVNNNVSCRIVSPAGATDNIDIKNHSFRNVPLKSLFSPPETDNKDAG